LHKNTAKFNYLYFSIFREKDKKREGIPKIMPLLRQKELSYLQPENSAHSPLPYFLNKNKDREKKQKAEPQA